MFNTFLQSHKIIISLSLIGFFSFLIKFIHLPFGIPLTADALFYFWYSADVVFLGHLPTDWTPLNNGWSLFNSLVFSLFQFNNIISFMDIQRISSVIFSVLTIIPVFIICKKFVNPKFAIIGAAIFGFDPRLTVNSLIGVTDPLYIFLGTCALALFLQSEKKFMYISFLLVSFTTLIRGEGLFFFLTLCIMFVVKFHNQKRFLIYRFPILVLIFLLIVLPMSLYRIDVDGNDGIFLRTSSSLENIVSKSTESPEHDSTLFFVSTFELFLKYLGWIHLPILVFLTPIGALLIFQKRNFEKYTIILSLGIMSLPALVAYSVPAYDTRYLYFLFPMFCVLSVLTIHRFLNNKQQQNLIIFLIICGIFILSFLFFDYIKYDHEKEFEYYEIAKQITLTADGVNNYSKSDRILIAQISNTWPILSSSLESKINIMDIDNFSSLDEFLSASKLNNISHLVVDENTDEQSFLYDVFTNEEKYSFLEKEYDSTKDEFGYNVKIFLINYENHLNSLND